MIKNKQVLWYCINIRQARCSFGQMLFFTFLNKFQNFIYFHNSASNWNWSLLSSFCCDYGVLHHFQQYFSYIIIKIHNTNRFSVDLKIHNTNRFSVDLNIHNTNSSSVDLKIHNTNRFSVDLNNFNIKIKISFNIKIRILKFFVSNKAMTDLNWFQSANFFNVKLYIKYI